MELTGYTDRWSVRPGEDICFYVHCRAPRYEARLVRLLHGDENPRGPGFREAELVSAIDGEHAGAARRIRKGSFATAELGTSEEFRDGATISIWIWPTLRGPAHQGIVTWGARSDREGRGLFLAPDGHVELRHEARTLLRGGAALSERQWYLLTLAVAASGDATLEIAARRWSPEFDRPFQDRLEQADAAAFCPTGTVVFAAGRVESTADGPAGHLLFNGKLARPRIRDAAGRVLAAWDFHREAGTTRLIDGGPHGRHGRTWNRPARLMTGPFWPGAARSSAAGPDTHDAIHFHDDDVADVGWPVSHRLTLDPDLPSGVYALRLRTASGTEDHLPFFVAPRRDGPAAGLAVLMPTMSYLAYANESLDVSDSVQLAPRQDMSLARPAYDYVAANGLKSTYDLHRDGSGIVHGSRRRPIIDFRPRARCRTFDAPHQFAADLHLIDWLTTRGYAFDVVTDDLLHEEGPGLLDRYKVVMTGSHPEYWTAAMLDARDDWLGRGGRLMYLGGNGFYWVTGVAEDEPDVIEVRRYAGTRTSAGMPGEETLSVTGERGGIWRDRGRSPHSGVGVGFSGQGFDRGAAYRRTAASHAPEWSWVFRGVDDEIVGAGPALVLGHGAAGFEVDKADPLQGTPAHAVVLASTERFTDAYQGAIESFVQIHPWTGGSDARSGVRSDITIMHGPNGGAVFSAGSITWSSTLSMADYDGDTARITANVLDAFLGGALPNGTE